ncbi:MAG: sensor histidine kinase [Hamadaea sp.]|uniref:sensor histidine kinase n=1 Tax=Hamadaea sp. TaxID=2024425 RepID=UPI0017F99260|nr:histidine kinase [Hamadaea sp.]NUR71196.1 sensor histidine kinase [Hamadaea sp.]NUT17727.1 sensor histidine kinase [Hamadaea sp.]
MKIFAPFMSAEERARLSDPITPKELRKRRMIGGVWALVWSFPILSLADDVLRATDTPWLAFVLFAAYVALYLYVVMRGFGSRLPFPPLRDQMALWAFTILGIILAVFYTREAAGGALILILYVAVAGVSLYPPPTAYFWVGGSSLLLGGMGLLAGDKLGDVASLVLNVLLATAMVLVVRNMIRLIRELDRTRTELARSAVEQERLRFARDLHDLLGHSLSLIVVKSEVVRRLAERDPAAAAKEAAEIEEVGRKALAEVREAVTGYRERPLSDELHGARGALTDAGIETNIRLSIRTDELPSAVDQAFAWVVREAATNVIRHSGARTTRIMLDRSATAWSLTVRDDGRGRAATATEGNGLRGLRERLAALDGTLTQSGPGFTLRADVPRERSES